MFDINAGEMVVIAIVALIVFGPTRLPDLARRAGRMTRELRAVALDFRRTLEREIDDVKNPVQGLTRELKEPIDQARASLREVGDELRQAGGDLRHAGDGVAGSFTWNGPIPADGPGPAEAAADLRRIESGEDLIGEDAPPGQAERPTGAPQHPAGEAPPEEPTP